MDAWKAGVRRAVNQKLDGAVAFEAKGGARLLLDVDVEFLDDGKSGQGEPFKVESITAKPPLESRRIFTQTNLPSLDTPYFSDIVAHEISHYLGAPDEYGLALNAVIAEGGVDPSTLRGPSHMRTLDGPVRPRSMWQLAQIVENDIAPAMAAIGLTAYEGTWSVVAP